MNTLGTLFRVTTFGESHGPAIGGVIDGMPPGQKISLDEVQRMLDRRRPGQSSITTQRSEPDRLQVLSGMYVGHTTGAPIGFIIPNTDTRPDDYAQLATAYRPSHADFAERQKYGIRDPRGGGRSSARATAAVVAAGAFAMQALRELGVTIRAYTSQIGTERLAAHYSTLDLSLENIDSNPVRCPDPAVAARMQALIEEARADADSLGGVVTCVVSHVFIGWGEPVFGKLQASLAHAMMNINAAKAFEYGMGFDGCARRGSEVLDPWLPGTSDHPKPYTPANHSGGIQGGISNGEDIYFRVGFKPVATLPREVDTITTNGSATRIKVEGRHDPCVVPRAVPIVEAMTAITLLDAQLQSYASC